MQVVDTTGVETAEPSDFCAGQQTPEDLSLRLRDDVVTENQPPRGVSATRTGHPGWHLRPKSSIKESSMHTKSPSNCRHCCKAGFGHRPDSTFWRVSNPATNAFLHVDPVPDVATGGRS
jgi:hypothetical protein